MGIIHFIWVGDKPMPADSIPCVKGWRELNPTAEIWVWIDGETIPREVLSLYQDKPASEGGFRDIGGVVFKDIAEIREVIETTHPDVKVPFAKQLRDLWELAAYECRRLRPNYGASSDILRYLILYFYSRSRGAEWSAYFDHDVEPGKAPIELTFERSVATLLFFHPNSQTSGQSGNDAFVCREDHHFIMKCILEEVWRNYTDKYPLNPLSRMGVYLSDEQKERIDSTIVRTGPMAVCDVMWKLYRTEGKERLPGWDLDDFKADEDECYGYRAPKSWSIPVEVCPGSENKAAWLGVAARGTGDRERAIVAACRSIQVEAHLMGVLRLDDHVDDCVEAVIRGASLDPALKSKPGEMPTEFEIDVARQLVHALEGMSLEAVMERSLISRYECIREFYKDRVPMVLDPIDRESMPAIEYFKKIIGKDSEDASPNFQIMLDDWLSSLVACLAIKIPKIGAEVVDARLKKLQILKGNLAGLLHQFPELEEKGMRISAEVKEKLVIYRKLSEDLYQASLIVEAELVSKTGLGTAAAAGAGK